MAEEGGTTSAVPLLIRVQLEMRVKFFQTLPSGACQQPARERLGKIVFQRDDIQNRSDRFRDIRGIRGGFAGHEFHELTRIEFFDSFCRDMKFRI